MKTTNYLHTFIEVAEDCPVATAQVPPLKGRDRTVANILFDLLVDAPYKLTSDDVLFQVHALRNELSRAELASAREEFFSKGQACLRASPLSKRYGWGVHCDALGRVAIVARESSEYTRLAGDPKLAHVKAMRTRRS
jgi:hypothetical protein